MADYYDGFDANARAERNKPGVERALEVLQELRTNDYYNDPSRKRGVADAEKALRQELTRINYLIAEMGDA